MPYTNSFPNDRYGEFPDAFGPDYDAGDGQQEIEDLYTRALEYSVESFFRSLLAKGVARDTAYRMVQRHALKVGRAGGDMKRELLGDGEIRRYLTPKDIEAIWGVKHYLTNIDFIFRRAFQ